MCENIRRRDGEIRCAMMQVGEGYLQSNLDARPDTQASEQDIPCYEFRYKKGAQVGALEASRDEAAGFRVVYSRTPYWELGSRRGQIANCRPISTTSSLGRWR